MLVGHKSSSAASAAASSSSGSPALLLEARASSARLLLALKKSILCHFRSFEKSNVNLIPVPVILTQIQVKFKKFCLIAVVSRVPGVQFWDCARASLCLANSVYLSCLWRASSLRLKRLQTAPQWFFHKGCGQTYKIRMIFKVVLVSGTVFMYKLDSACK